MPHIKFVSHDDQSTEVYADVGASLMESAVYHGITGVVAECGGACSCATCHVYIDPEWVARLPERGDEELDLLEFAVDLRENSRLSCQIEITDELDGMVVRTPLSQY